MKLNAAAMHSDLEQERREEVMLDFKNGKIDLLVATDIVARGIDIEDIGLVINYDVPHDPEDYIHRIGRTARAAATGAAITFVCVEEQGKFHRIEEFIEREIPKRELPEGLGDAPEYRPSANSGRGGRGGRGGRSGKSGGSGRSGRSRGRADKPRAEAQKPAASAAATAPAESAAAAAKPAEEGAKKARRRHRGGRRHRRGDKAAAANDTQKTQE